MLLIKMTYCDFIEMLLIYYGLLSLTFLMSPPFFFSFFSGFNIIQLQQPARKKQRKKQTNNSLNSVSAEMREVLWKFVSATNALAVILNRKLYFDSKSLFFVGFFFLFRIRFLFLTNILQIKIEKCPGFCPIFEYVREKKKKKQEKNVDFFSYPYSISIPIFVSLIFLSLFSSCCSESGF